MSELEQALDKHEENVDYLTRQGALHSAGADLVNELVPAPRAEETIISSLEQSVEKHEENLDATTGQGDAKAVEAGMGNGLAKAAIVGVVGIVLGTVAAALAGKIKTQFNRTVKDVGDAAKDVANGVNHTVKNTVDTVKDIEDANLSAKGAVDTVKDTASEHQTFKLYEERLVADKRKVNTAEVSIGKHVETQTAHISVSLEKERVVVERIIPVNAKTPVALGEANFSEGEIARIKVYEETPDVQKLAFLREEISVRKEVEQVSVQVEDTIRREELDVDIQDTNVINETKTL